MKTRDEIKKAIQEADKREEKTIEEISLFFGVLITTHLLYCLSAKYWI